ncbi:MAG: TIGR00282 family metallophosphoesterase [Candidatus Doudnabacteria bacterium]|nr:TIGR00282 family metallophosphoesterase [Candidatus Doudnabacteria bacterium]
MRILFFGDVVGKAGRAGLRTTLPELREEFKSDLIVANAENVAHGVGITLKTANELFASGVDFLTSGNHVFDRKEQTAEVFEVLSGRLIRPANFPDSYPGKGWEQISVQGKKLLMVNLNAQVFMEKQFSGEIRSPFITLDRILQTAPKSDIIIVDFHSEATSEKRGFGFYADGKVAAVVGTHTHVQTADAQVLPQGTAYISDVGMCGARQSVLGVKTESALNRFLTGERTALEVEEAGEIEVGAVLIEIDHASGKAKHIQSFLRVFPAPVL